MTLNNRPIVGPGAPIGIPQTVKKQDVQSGETNFGTILKDKIHEQSGLKFSKHAEARLQARRISLNSNQMERIKDGVNKAEEKGVKDSLILMDNVALVVNVKSKTVVTAASTGDLKESIFTNIDGAVIV